MSEYSSNHDHGYEGASRLLNISFLIKVIAFAALFYLVVPTLVIFPLSLSSSRNLAFPPPGWSLEWYRELFASQAYRDAFLNSVLIGIPASLIATVLGTLSALGSTQREGPSTRAFTALVMAPMLFPQVVLAIGLYATLARLGLLGSYTGVIMAHAAMGVPLVFVPVSASLRLRSGRLEQAAETMGADPWTVFWTVTFPGIRAAVVVGAIFVFAFSFDEVILSLFLTSSTTMTLPKQLFSELRFNMTPIVAAASSVIVLITLVLLTTVALVTREKKRV